MEIELDPSETYSCFQKVLRSHYYSMEQKPSPNLFNSLVQIFFPKPSDLIDPLLFLKSNYRKEVCSAVINQGDLSFKCYDCGRDNEFHIYCEACFKNGEHYGHRMMYSCERGGCCDCGDSGAIDEIGFCQFHKGYAGIDNQIVKKIPSNLVFGIEKLFCWGFEMIIREFERILLMQNEYDTGDYSLKPSELIHVMDIEKVAKESNEKKKEEEILKNEEAKDSRKKSEDSFLTDSDQENNEKETNFFDLNEKQNFSEEDKGKKLLAIEREKEKLRCFYVEFFGFMTEQCTDNLSMTFLISEILLKKEKSEEFFHKCNDLENIGLEKEKKKCTCTFLELLFRFISMLEDKVQESMEKFFFNLFANFEFKKQLVITYSRMFNFLINIKKLPDGKFKGFTSKIRPVYTQFFSEHLMDLFLANGFLENSLAKMKKLMPLIVNEDYEMFYDKFLEFINVFFFVNERKNSMKKWLFNTNIMEDFLLALFENRKEAFFSLNQQKILLYIQKLSLNLLEEYIMHYYGNLKLEEFNVKILGLISFMFKNCEYFFSTRDEFIQKCKSHDILFVHENGIRVLGMLFSYLLAANQDIRIIVKLLSSLDKNFLYFLLERNAQVVMIYQDITHRKQNEFQSLPIYHETKSLLQAFFAGQLTGFLDYHIVSLQILSNLLDKDSLRELFFSPLNPKNPFFLQEDQEYRSKATPHFFTTIGLIVTHEAAWLNTSSLLKIDKKGTDLRNKILCNLLANMFLVFPKISYKDLKSRTQKHALSKNIEIKDHLLEIAELNNETKDFKLKVQLEEVYEPFFWGNVWEIGSKYFENLRELSKKNNKMDMLLGAPGKYEGNPLIMSLFGLIINHDLLEFILACLERMSSINDTVRNSLKILYLFLEYQTKNQTLIYFFSKYEKSLVKILETLRKNKQFEEVNSSLAIISKYLNKMSQSSAVSSKINEESDVSEKEAKRIAQKKAILAQYAQKQKVFLDKNQDMLVEPMAVEEKELSSCCICHDKKSGSREIFELSAFVVADRLHNYYYSEREKSAFIVSEKILNDDRFLVSSCNHQVHRDCLQAFLTNKKLDNYRQIDPELNFKCSYCKFSCNLSVPIISSFVQQEISKEVENCPNQFMANLKGFVNDAFKFIENCSEKQEFLLEKDLIRPVIDEFANKLMTNVINFKNEVTHEYYMIDVFEESLVFFSEEAFSEGLDYFVKRRFFLNRNLYLIAKELFWNNRNSSSFENYLHGYKQKLMKDVEKLLILDENPVYFLRNIDAFMAKILWRLAILFPLERKDTAGMALLKILAKIFLNKLIFVFSFFFLKEQEEKSPNAKNILKAFEIFDFRVKVLSFMLPYFHLLSSFFFVINNFEGNFLSQKLLKNLEIDQEILQLSSLFGNLFHLSTDIFEIFSPRWLDTLESLNQIQNKVLGSEILKNPGLKFTFPLIANEFQTFYTKYVNKKCDICKDYPRTMKADLYVCLICEAVLCNSYCSKASKTSGSTGNLTKHLLEKHCGKGIFVNIMDTKIIIFDVPTVFLEDFLYSDSLGQTMTKKSLNWGDFFLNKKKLEKLRSLLVRREISQEIYESLLKNPNSVILTDQI